MHVNTGYLKEAVSVVLHHVHTVNEADSMLPWPFGSCPGSIRHQQAIVARRAGATVLAEARHRARPAHCN